MTSAAKTYDIHLEIFEGPLDLLLYLIRKSDLNIYDIPISKITAEYLAYLDIMKEMNLDVAGEFLVMASTLMQIKAHTLLPAAGTELDEGPDPRAELINRLLEYQRYKEAAKELHTRLEAGKNVFYRGNTPVFTEDDYHMNSSLFDLLDAFRDVLTELSPTVREVVYEEIPIETKIRDILGFMEGKPYVTFRELLHLATDRHGLIVTFLAILELIRLKQIAARQVQVFGEIRVYRVEEGVTVPPVIEEMTAAADLMPAMPPMPPGMVPARGEGYGTRPGLSDGTPTPAAATEGSSPESSEGAARRRREKTPRPRPSAARGGSGQEVAFPRGV